MDYIPYDELSDIQKSVVDTRLQDEPLSYKNISKMMEEKHNFLLYDSLIVQILRRLTPGFR